MDDDSNKGGKVRAVEGKEQYKRVVLLK